MTILNSHSPVTPRSPFLPENAVAPISGKARPGFVDTRETKASRNQYLTLNDFVGGILDAASTCGLSRKGRDTIAGFHRTLRPNSAAYELHKRSRESIGRKISGLRSDNPERFKKTAGARLWQVFNQDLPRCGKQLIAREAITKDGKLIEAGDQGETYFDYWYTDYTIPAAQAAFERARNHPDWRYGDGQSKQAILREACEWALETLVPDCLTPEAGDREPNKLDCEAYAQMGEARVLRDADAYMANIANDYEEPDRAQSFALHLSRKFAEQAASYHRIAYKRKNPLAALKITSPLSDGATDSETPTVEDFQPSLLPNEGESNSPPEKEEDVILTLGAKTEPISEEIPAESAPSLEVGGGGEKRPPYGRKLQ